MIDLTNKVILVTGATGGIGAEIAHTLARAGGTVVAHFNTNRAAAEGIVGAIGSERALAVQADLESAGGPTALVHAAIAFKGRLDVVVNNAAIMPAASIDDPLDAWHDAWHRTLQVNLVAVADICRETVKHFVARGGGILVNVASRAAFRGDTPEYMQYAASKGGLVALTRSIARGFAAKGVLAYGVAPGFVDAGMAKGFIERFGAEAILRDIPLGEMAGAADVANVVAFLCSGLAKHATGTTIDINGASYVR